MAIYHYSVQVISRGAGRSVVAAAAYRAAQALTDERTGLTHDYSAKAGVAHSEILAPEQAPAWMLERSALWNGVEAGERRRDAQTAREVNLALPKELSAAAQIELVRAFVREQFVARGMVADLAVHLDDPNNPHAHILLTLRAVTAEGFGAKRREWNSKEDLLEQREAWARHINGALERAGHGARVDHRSLAAQGIEREPTFHLGPAVYEMEARGIATEKVERWRNIISLNAYRANKLARQALVDRTIEYLSRQHSTFGERDVARYLSKRAGAYLGGEELRALTHQTLADARVVALGRDAQGSARYSTHELRTLEEQLLRRAQAMAAGERHAVGRQALAAVAARYTLTAEQEAAYRHITAPAQLAVVEGMAGTGKTHLLRAAREAWEASGYQVLGAALAGRAASGLQQAAGIDARTLHSLTLQLEDGRLRLMRNTVLVVDEAGMVGSRQLARVLAHAERAEAKVVLIGDSRQLQPIDAGGAFRLLAQRVGHAALTDIRRQQHHWERSAVAEFARGEAGAALARYHERGLVTIRDDKAQAIAAVFGDWQAVRASSPEKSQLILAGTRAEVRALNVNVRENLKGRGELAHGAEIETVNGRREFAPGDRVLLLQRDARLQVNNGDLGRVTHLHHSPDGTRLGVALDDGRSVVIDPKRYPHLDHGYAMTVHKAQGVTVDRAYVLAGHMHDRELTYVSMSRTREPTRLYLYRHGDEHDTRALARLAERMARSRQKDTSLDYPPPVHDRGRDDPSRDRSRGR